MHMELPKQTQQIGDDLLLWDQLLLRRADGSEIKLTPKAAQVLALLLSHSGQTVSRSTLFDTIWPGSFSNDEVLTTVINELRRAFGDSARQARCIATVPKLGYRWMGPLAQVIAPDAPAEAPAELPLSPSVVELPAATPTDPAPDGRRVLSASWLGALLLVLLLAAGRWLAVPSDRPAAEAPPQPQLALTGAVSATTEPGLDQDPDLARDGEHLVYVHVADGAAELRVRRLGQRGFERLDLSVSGRPAAPVWSPDARQIAFLWIENQHCELRLLELTSARLSTLAEGCSANIESSVDWSADGRQLVFSRIDESNPALGSRNLALFTVAPDGSNLRRLSHARRWLIADVHPRFSPDGSRVAFVRDGDGRHQLLHLRASDGGDEQELSLEMWVYRVEWLNSGQVLVAGHGRSPFDVWRMALDGSSAQQLAGSDLGPGLSVGGSGAQRRLLIEQRRRDDNLWRLSLSDALASPQRLTDSTRTERDPRLSPDGSLLAFLVDDNGSLEVELLELASGRRRALSRFAPLSALDARWSPDGSMLAVVLGTGQGKRLALLDLNGRQRPLPAAMAELSVAQADWNGAGDRLLLVLTRDGRRELRALRYPELSGEELLVDFSVGSLVREVGSGRVLLTHADSGVLQELRPDGVLSRLPDLQLRAAPHDHWVLGEGWLVQSQQGQPGDLATLQIQPLSTGQPARELRLRLTDPPLGRPFDIGGGSLWYAQRDTDEADLISVLLPE